MLFFLILNIALSILILICNLLLPLLFLCFFLPFFRLFILHDLLCSPGGGGGFSNFSFICTRNGIQPTDACIRFVHCSERQQRQAVISFRIPLSSIHSFHHRNYMICGRIGFMILSIQEYHTLFFHLFFLHDKKKRFLLFVFFRIVSSRSHKIEFHF